MNEENLSETIDENVRWLREWNMALEMAIADKETQVARNNQRIKELLLKDVV